METGKTAAPRTADGKTGVWFFRFAGGETGGEGVKPAFCTPAGENGMLKRENVVENIRDKITISGGKRATNLEPRVGKTPAGPHICGPYKTYRE